MRCCVPFCKNTSDNISTSEWAGKGISFHGFPSEVHLRAAWLRALSKQDSHLPDSAVVCSQHFLNDEIYETESGLRQIVTGAIPTTVQVCMICLDTDSKLILMSKHKLAEAYEKLTGHPLYDPGKLKQTVCVECAQRLINFRRFRDKSLRARALMMDLVEKYELITRRHIKMINRTKHQLKSNMVLTTLGPDHCDLHILEHPSEDKQTELEESYYTDVLKTESDDTMSVDEDLELMYKEYDFVQDPLKNENAHFQCIPRLEDKYMRHMSVHLQSGDGDGECATSQVCKPHTAVNSSSSHSSLITENKQANPSPSAYLAQTSVAPASTTFATSIENKVHTTTEADVEQKVKRKTNNDGIRNTSVDSKIFTNCVVRLCDIIKIIKVPRRDNSLTKTRNTVRCCDVQNIASKDFSHQATNQNEVPTTEYIVPVTNSSSRVKVTVSKTLQSETDNSNIQCINSSQYSSYTAKSPFICDICQKKYERKDHLAQHMTAHSEVRPFTCNICQNKYKCKNHLTKHMKIHTSEKPYACGLCKYKSIRRADLVYHIRTHTGEKPYACRFCEYKCLSRSGLGIHMRIHTGENLYTCNICNSKFARNSSFRCHMRTHTGIKPYPCELCQYKFTQKGNLIRHMRIHTGEKPYSCTLCEYKCSDKSTLKGHMKTHSGEQ